MSSHIALIGSSTVAAAIIVLMVMVPSSVEIVATTAAVIGTLVALLSYLRASADKSR